MKSRTIGPALVAVGDGTARRGCLRIDGDRVAGVDDASSRADFGLPEGCTITPGLIDLQVNGMGKHWFNVQPLEALNSLSTLGPKYGVTSFLPSVMTSRWDEMLHAARAIYRSVNLPTAGARALGVHFEGPFLSHEYRRVHPKEFLLTPNPMLIEALLETWATGRCRVTMAPEIEEAPRASAELRRHGVTLAAGHTGATYAVGNAAIEQGYGILTHAFNGMPPIDHHSSSILVSYLLDPAVFCEVIADGIHVSPEHIALLYRLKGVNLVLTTDAMPVVEGLVMEGGAVRKKDGTIAGSALTLDQALRNLISATGISLAEAVVCASWAPARALGIDGDTGLLRAGLRADFVVWDRRTSVAQVFIGGELVYAND